MLRVDQRPLKRRMHEAIDGWEDHGDMERFASQLDAALDFNDYYLHRTNVRDMLLGLLEIGNVRRARQFVDHIPDATASRLVVGLQLAVMGALLLLGVALVVGVAVFLWQHFFG